MNEVPPAALSMIKIRKIRIEEGLLMHLNEIKI
jgi:hypothetical protein